MKDKRAFQRPWMAMNQEMSQAKSHEERFQEKAQLLDNAAMQMRMTFDDTGTLSGLKRLQDPAKFEKARFAFRLYKG